MAVTEKGETEQRRGFYSVTEETNSRYQFIMLLLEISLLIKLKKQLSLFFASSRTTNHSLPFSLTLFRNKKERGGVSSLQKRRLKRIFLEIVKMKSCS
jgi:hypothetical protein